MRFTLLLILVVLLTSCFREKTSLKSIVIKGDAPKEAEYLLLGNDTIDIINGTFDDTLSIDENIYDYLKLSTWKWPKLIYLDGSKNLFINFSESKIQVSKDEVNAFLLNSDSILHPYSLKWDMDESTFISTIDTELKTNLEIIDSVVTISGISNEIKSELKSIEILKVAHRAANFISFQERKGKLIDRRIYDFVNGVNLNNKRLEKQENNRNFQYFYLMDKVSEEVPDSIYPFAVIDTVNKYSDILSIRKMIITAAVKSSFYNEKVDHSKLLEVYQDNFGKLESNEDLFLLQEKIRKLKLGSQAPSIGSLENANGGITRIEDLKGMNILFTVWGTWCPFCKEELPALKELITKHGDKFTNVGISFDKNKDRWKAYIKENHWKGIHLIDSKRKSVFKSNYLINGTNVHLLIDKEGTIVSSKAMKPSSRELEALIIALQ